MTVALRVIDGGWQREEAHVEALAFMDEVADEARALCEILQDLEATYRIRVKRVLDPRWRRAEWKASRLISRAETASSEYRDLLGGDAA